MQTRLSHLWTFLGRSCTWHLVLQNAICFPYAGFHSYFTIPNFFFSLTEKPNDRFCILSKVAALEQSYYSLRISTTICFHIKRLACA